MYSIRRAPTGSTRPINTCVAANNPSIPYAYI
jgi:hypothetical protein